MDTSHPNFWPEVLGRLKLRMPKATFDSCLLGTEAWPENGHLAVLVKPLAMDFIEKRFRPLVEQAVSEVAGKELPIEFTVEVHEEAEEEDFQPELIVTGAYRDKHNEIVKPDALVCTTKYFFDKWRPLLGETLWLIIWEMRRHCYWNPKTGEKRDKLRASYPDLAKMAKMSESTVKRVLNPKDPVKQALLDRFILRRETKRRYSQYRGGTVNDAMVWRVRLDDPLTPDDEAKWGLSKGQNDT